MEENKKPVNTYRIGALSVSEWVNEFEGKLLKSYTFQRTYKDAQDNWQHTTILREQDLLKLSILFQQIVSKDIVINNK